MKKITVVFAIFAIAMFASTVFAGPITGRISRTIPQGTPDAAEGAIRAGKYGEVSAIGPTPTKHFYSDEGSYYVATNATIGTAVAHVVLSAFDDTKPYFYFRNTEVASAQSPAKRVYLDYIKIIVKTVPASAAEWSYAGRIDYGTARYTSGGTAVTPVSPNGDINTPSILQMYAGAITAAAAVSGRTVARGQMRGVIPTIYDEYVVVFGTAEGGGAAIGAAASSRSVSTAPPVIIGPQENFCFFMWGASSATTAGQFEFEIGWWER
jgi:hypothetical protein